MSFVVNSREWSFDGWEPQEILSAIESILERVAISNERGERIWIGDDFEARAMFHGKDLWSFLSDERMSTISQDVKNELAAWMGRASYYADEEMPPGMLEASEIRVDESDSECNFDLAWAHHHVRNNTAVACLSLCRTGTRVTTSSLESVNVHWVLDEKSVVDFWRDAVDVERDSRETIERLGPHAYPNLYFYPGVWAGLDSLTDGYVPLRKIIRKYLEGLNDDGAWIFTAAGSAIRREDEKVFVHGSPSDQLIIERFSAIQLNVSPEKANVKKHVASREAREVTVLGKILYCEWHGKFERHQNRIYFHRPVLESKNRIVIGIINHHL